jgi:hypothetical protein
MPEPFVYLDTQPPAQLDVLPGHEGFVVHDGGRLHLPPGRHDLDGQGAAAVFLVRLAGSHTIELRSLGEAMLRDAGGRWRPIQLLGRLVYGIARADLLIDLLQRERICEPRQLEHEMSRTILGLLPHVFDGGPLQADQLSENLDYVSGELLRRVSGALEPHGIAVQGLDLVAEPAACAGGETRA